MTGTAGRDDVHPRISGRVHRSWRAAVLGAAALGAVGAGCARTSPAPRPGPAAAPAASAPPPKPAPPATWDYSVTASPGARELFIDARFPPGSGTDIGIEEEVFPFVRDLCVVAGSKCDPPAAQGMRFYVPACQMAGCQLRYRFALAEAAARMRDPDVAQAYDQVVVAPPSSWLVRPLIEAPGRQFRFQVTSAPGNAFASGVAPAPNDAGWFSALADDLAFTPYSVFGKVDLSRSKIGASELEIGFAPGEFAVGQRRISAWIDDAARIVSDYYGHFPVGRALLVILPTEGRGLGYGKALGNGGASMLVPLGRRTDEAALRDDWVLVHEMLHLGFPSLPRQHIWLAEGIATYVEPIARVRGGNMTAEAAWNGLVRGVPHGLPAPGDQGLDKTHTWGRTYWGGALFCLLADLDIREKTQNRRSLDDALRAVLEKGGSITARWDIEKVLDIGDGATGVPVLRDLYQTMALRPRDVDLKSLWDKLGIKTSGKSVVFDDAAPLAAVRKSITERPALPSPRSASR